MIPSEILTAPIIILYLLATVGLLCYGLNCYVMIALFGRRRREADAALPDMLSRLGDPMDCPDLPVVTTQIAVYNEFNVVERIMRAACCMRYPAGRHEIQVLDDSNDETREEIDRVAKALRAEGHDLSVVRRPTREGFKAGALANGLRMARGEVVAVFDADFVPPEDYLLSTVPFFLEEERLGFVQTRWGHVNREHSLLTRVQSIGIDGHFLIEQTARCWGNLYMNFNGTAGVWRRRAIEEAGDWQWDTLTEDLDLSYRVQFAGWTTRYLPGVVCPAELPEDVNALRGQQFRWAKGSFQTLIKLFKPLMRARAPVFKKLQAVLHMSGYFVHPLMLTLSLLALPLLTLFGDLRMNPVVFAVLAVPLAFSVLAPSTMYLVSQKVAYRDWLRRIALLPLLIVVGVGLALSNTRAILEAVIRRESEFVRTPKRGDRNQKAYRIRLPWLAFAEILLGAYCMVTLRQYMAAAKYGVVPFLAIYAAGFLFIGLLTLAHTLGVPENGWFAGLQSLRDAKGRRRPAWLGSRRVS